MWRASVHGVGRWVRPGATAAIALAAVLVLSGCSQGSTAVASSDPSHGAGGADLADVVPSGEVWQPGQARMPADLTGVPVRCPAPSDGWQATEDQQLGEPGFQVPPDDGPVTGYADRGSAGCGDTVGVSLSGPVSRVQLRAYRVGAYRGATVRLVWMSPEVQVVPRAMPPLQSGTRLREPSWPVSVRVPVTAQWPPGFYLLVPHAAGGPAGPAVPLIVRDDADRAPALFVASTMTWNAYNEWGGYSLFTGPAAPRRPASPPGHGWPRSGAPWWARATGSW